MSTQPPKQIEWFPEEIHSWGLHRIKSLFDDTSDSISPSEMENLTVEHYSIPAFDESGAPNIEGGESINSSKKRLKGGELLFSKLNSHKPRVWQVDKKGLYEQVASTEFISLVPWPSSTVSKTFFLYLLSSNNFIDYIKCFQTAVTNSHKRIKPRNLLQMHVGVPPLFEQELISTYIGVSCDAIDKAVEAKQQQLETLDAMRKSIVQRAVTQGIDPDVEMVDSSLNWLGMMPRHWQVKKLKRVFSSVDYGISESTNQEGNCTGQAKPDTLT